MSQSLILKILILGSDSVENYKIIADRYFSTDYKTIVGVNVLSKAIPLNVDGIKTNVTLSMWDISSNTRFEEMRKLFFKGGVGALFLFDLDTPSTWYHIIECYKELEITLRKIPFLVIGNSKKKHTSSIKENDVKSWVNEKGGQYILLDPDNMKNLEKTFGLLIQEILSKNY